MNRSPVTSSNLRSVCYDASAQMLEVEFNDGSIYQYYGVLGNSYQGLIAAGSKGGYLASQVKGVYPYERIS